MLTITTKQGQFKLELSFSTLALERVFAFIGKRMNETWEIEKQKKQMLQEAGINYWIIK